MKKFFAIALIFLLALTGCGSDDGDGSNAAGVGSSTTLMIKNQSSKTLEDVMWDGVVFDKSEGKDSDAIGTWTGVFVTRDGLGQIRNFDCSLEVSASSWIFFLHGPMGDSSFSGTWIRDGNIFSFKTDILPNYECGTGAYSRGVLVFVLTGLGQDGTCNLTKVSDPFKSGTSITKIVEDGSGYIFFKVNSTDYRTNELVVVEDAEKTEFTFINSTVIVEVSSGTTTTLGAL